MATGIRSTPGTPQVDLAKLEKAAEANAKAATQDPAQRAARKHEGTTIVQFNRSSEQAVKLAAPASAVLAGAAVLLGQPETAKLLGVAPLMIAGYTTTCALLLEGSTRAVALIDRQVRGDKSTAMVSGEEVRPLMQAFAEATSVGEKLVCANLAENLLKMAGASVRQEAFEALDTIVQQGKALASDPGNANVALFAERLGDTLHAFGKLRAQKEHFVENKPDVDDFKECFSKLTSDVQEQLKPIFVESLNRLGLGKVGHQLFGHDSARAKELNKLLHGVQAAAQAAIQQDFAMADAAESALKGAIEALEGFVGGKAAAPVVASLRSLAEQLESARSALRAAGEGSPSPEVLQRVKEAAQHAQQSLQAFDAGKIRVRTNFYFRNSAASVADSAVATARPDPKQSEEMLKRTLEALEGLKDEVASRA